MKIFKKILCLTLAVMFTLSLCACESSAEKMEALSGTYTMTAVDTEEQVKILLDSIEAYDEEVALVDISSLKYVQIVSFDAEGNYYYTYDVAATKECVRSFYEDYFNSLYAGRTTLNDVYDFDFTDLTEDEFKQLYAEIYECTDYANLIDTLVDNAYNYDTLSQPWEEGTYTIRSGRIYCTIAGKDEAEAMGYKLDGNTLTLIYSNTEETYTKVN